ncbi:ribonuclease HII [Qipengyuania sp. DSG2-2]|uniref:ribonuclease HII n=1 Tax=Qipengyuania sp. DGS2-2 TaxID=3349631 RepID=UPI0036D3F299
MNAATPDTVSGFRPDAFSLPEQIIAGVDEAGRGPLAGPVVAGAVVLCKPRPQGLDDSKKLTAKRRAVLDETVRARCAWAVGVVGPATIDRINIFAATMLAMTLATARLEEVLGRAIDRTLIDGNMTPQGRTAGWCWPARPIVGGDALEPAISAASIVAKEWRDRMMLAAAREYPEYDWEKNKGYGTRTHMEALRQYGPTPLHRRSFAPVAQAELSL